MSAAWRWWCAAFVLAASALAQQPPLPATEPATGSIEGTVLDAVIGEPIRKAEVGLNGAAARGGAPTDLKAGTDASGRFAFRALPGGTYWLHAQHPGYGAPVLAVSQIALASGEQKSGIEIRLPPRGSIGGKVVDEFGAPVANCLVNALRPQSQGGRRRLTVGGSAATDDRGEYWIQGLESGRYYVALRCNGELEAPHPLMPARDPRKPRLVYAPQFYPDVPDANGATRLRVTPGIETQSVDFQVRRVFAVTVRVRVDVADPSLLQSVHVQLLPPSLDPFDGAVFGGGLDRHTGEFQIRAVIPGSYVLVASTSGNGPLYQAQLPLQIAAAPPDPIRLALTRPPEISGTLQVEGDNPPALDRLLVTLEPLGSFVFTRPAAHVNKDGAFTLADVTPGRWRLSVAGVSYLKTLSIGDRDVSPYGFDLAPGTAGSIRILASNKTGQVQVTVSAASGAGDAVSLLLVPADPERFESGLLRAGSAGRGGQQTIHGIVPGRYRLFAFDGPVTWNMQQMPEVLKALESRAQVVDVGEGQTAQATADPIEVDRLKEALDETQ